MKKILFIIPSKSVGGTNSSLSSVIKHLRPLCDIHVMLMSSSGTGQYEFLSNSYCPILLDAFYTGFKELDWNVKCYSIFIKLLKRLFYLFHIPFENWLYKFIAYKYQRIFGYDIVVGFSEGISMRMASEFNATQKFTWIHCEYDRAVPQHISELFHYEKFQKIVCVSRYTKEQFLKRYPSLKHNTTYIHNLLDIDRILSLSSSDIDDSRFITNKFTILSVGRMDPVKRFSAIPRIAFELLKKDMQFVWYILGGPYNEEYMRLTREIEKYGVGQNVIPLGLKLNPYPYFKNSNLYVATSESEACPMVLNEASLLGLPIITTDFGSAYEFILNNSQISSIDKIADLISRKYKSGTGFVKCDAVYDRDYRAREKLEQLFVDYN